MNKKLQFVIFGDVPKKLDFCHSCVFLRPETEQRERKINHFCEKYQEAVYHRECHPQIVKTEQCLKESETKTLKVLNKSILSQTISNSNNFFENSYIRLELDLVLDFYPQRVILESGEDIYVTSVIRSPNRCKIGGYLQTLAKIKQPAISHTE